MGEQLQVGFLGAGLIANYDLKSLRQSGVAVERAGVYDPDQRRATSFAAASGHTTMNDEDEVLDSCDAVYVCTWTSEHLRQVEKAADRGLAIFCEKPLAFDVSAAQLMAAVVAKAGVVNQVGLVLRHSPAYLWTKHLIDDPAARRVMGVVCRDDQYIPSQGQYGSTWRSDRTLAGAGTLLEHSIHDVDMFRFLAGDELATAVAPMRDGSDNPDACFVRAAESGTPATPDFADAVMAQLVIDAMYASAARDGDSVTVGS